MNTLEDLRSAVKQTLEQNGSLAATRAKLRADIFKTLDDPSEVKPRIPHENLLINELILEYLNYNNLHCAASVLSVESGQPTPSLGRTFVAEQLNIHEDDKTRQLPLLYSLLSHFVTNSKTASRTLSNRTN
ncbi:unnamed protein product [Rotaria magnacalcarata]|uniref:Centrosomal protein 20 n=1 Tax=Rotaria magnacalcarata TaxID=392030 RepID=A0A816V2K9_9BILA|nr:unnamed protein product [Rotaria magnacalcarata]CAF1637037.1 unnamed protein product [Rotaria magnacalcarata]CAF2103682.1 unnamed protein product [Rotaria magnacalcarata]CAF2119076.1 unnamed protein product [Rotaria magnacalcarata]CAF2182634.1 unnamed protein product [Rotaria magnacalcarata]